MRSIFMFDDPNNKGASSMRDFLDFSGTKYYTTLSANTTEYYTDDFWRIMNNNFKL